jgi:hypothetical protein
VVQTVNPGSKILLYEGRAYAQLPMTGTIRESIPHAIYLALYHIETECAKPVDAAWLKRKGRTLANSCDKREEAFRSWDGPLAP